MCVFVFVFVRAGIRIRVPNEDSYGAHVYVCLCFMSGPLYANAPRCAGMSPPLYKYVCITSNLYDMRHGVCEHNREHGLAVVVVVVVVEVQQAHNTQIDTTYLLYVCTQYACMLIYAHNYVLDNCVYKCVCVCTTTSNAPHNISL